MYTQQKRARRHTHIHTPSAWVELISTRGRWNSPSGVRTEGCDCAHRSSLVAFDGPVVSSDKGQPSICTHPFNSDTVSKETPPAGAREGGWDLEGVYSPVLSECQEEGEYGWSDGRVEEWRERGRRERQEGWGDVV